MLIAILKLSIEIQILYTKIKKIILKKILQNLVLTGKWGVMKKFY